jgi:hypothetical protein
MRVKIVVPAALVVLLPVVVSKMAMTSVETTARHLSPAVRQDAVMNSVQTSVPSAAAACAGEAAGCNGKAAGMR